MVVLTHTTPRPEGREIQTQSVLGRHDGGPLVRRLERGLYGRHRDPAGSSLSSSLLKRNGRQGQDIWRVPRPPILSGGHVNRSHHIGNLGDS